ncbi:MAG: hypothetical protein ACYDAG_07590 [Chloroflexota bacterium]
MSTIGVKIGTKLRRPCRARPGQLRKRDLDANGISPAASIRQGIFDLLTLIRSERMPNNAAAV